MRVCPQRHDDDEKGRTYTCERRHVLRDLDARDALERASGDGGGQDGDDDFLHASPWERKKSKGEKVRLGALASGEQPPVFSLTPNSAAIEAIQCSICSELPLYLHICCSFAETRMKKRERGKKNQATKK